MVWVNSWVNIIISQLCFICIYIIYIYIYIPTGVRCLHPWSHQLDCTREVVPSSARSPEWAESSIWFGVRSCEIALSSAYLFITHFLLNQTCIIFGLQEKHLSTGTAFKGFLKGFKKYKTRSPKAESKVHWNTHHWLVSVYNKPF